MTFVPGDKVVYSESWSLDYLDSSGKLVKRPPLVTKVISGMLVGLKDGNAWILVDGNGVMQVNASGLQHFDPTL